MKHFLSILETPTDEVVRILARGRELRGKQTDVLKDQTLAILFEKPSLRTRVSFEEAMYRLGGRSIVLGQSEVGLGKRESVEDVSRVLAGMAHGMCLRVFDHTNLVKMAKVSSVPIVNALSDLAHPAQALADAMTLADEFSAGDATRLKGRTVVFIGDGNNVARSLAVICGKLGMKFRISVPDQFALSNTWVEKIRAAVPGFDFASSSDPMEFLAEADAVYADTFVSMGEETGKESKLGAFDGFQLNDELLSHCPDHTIVMHCLPAYRGTEITDSVMDGKRSRVFAQAHNRLHAQIGLLAELMGG
ncbi:MAG: ornithine carbamoyltransferase [Phycisphaerales bacterium]|nr:ornithine carbamoyltransferase [Phycisphaerales bacterium]